MDRLSPANEAFLHGEGPNTHMHGGAVARFDGPAPPLDELLRRVRSRLHLVPRYRQKLARPPLGLGGHRWVDDPTFNLEYHVRHTGLPAPGDEDRLRTLAARIFSQRLDRTKPLWELWFVEGLGDGSFALVSKVHHVLVDGFSDADLMTMLFDDGPARRHGPADRWQPRPEPSGAQLAAMALNDSGRELLEAPLRALSVATRPEAALGSARDLLGDVARAALNPAPDTPLNVRVGPHRRLAFVAASLEDFRTVKDALGGTVHDVVLAVVAGGLRRWLHHRGRRTEGMDVRAGVPVSVRTADEGAGSRGLASVPCRLPIFVADPVERLDHVRRQMADIKESEQALGAETISRLPGFAPPTILAQASRLDQPSRAYNVLVTNVPGPQSALYVLGHRLRAVHPVPSLGGDRALAVAVMSYDGSMDFGLLADYDALPDLDVIAEGIRDSLSELVSAVGGPGGRPRATRIQQRARAKRARARAQARSPRSSPP